MLLGNFQLESTVRYLGKKVDDALEVSEQTETLVSGGPAAWSELDAAGSERPLSGIGPISQSRPSRVTGDRQLLGPQVGCGHGSSEPERPAATRTPAG